MERQERLDETKVVENWIGGVYFLVIESISDVPVTYSFLCPFCYHKTYWQLGSMHPKRCMDCGKRLSIRVPLPKEKKECPSTKSDVPNAD